MSRRAVEGVVPHAVPSAALCSRCGFAPCMCPSRGAPFAEAISVQCEGPPTKERALRAVVAILECLDDEDRVRVVDALAALMRIG